MSVVGINNRALPSVTLAELIPVIFQAKINIFGKCGIITDTLTDSVLICSAADPAVRASEYPLAVLIQIKYTPLSVIAAVPHPVDKPLIKNVKRDLIDVIRFYVSAEINLIEAVEKRITGSGSLTDKTAV